MVVDTPSLSWDTWDLLPDVQILESGVIRVLLDLTVPKEIYPDLSTHYTNSDGLKCIQPNKMVFIQCAA